MFKQIAISYSNSTNIDAVLYQTGLVNNFVLNGVIESSDATTETEVVVRQNQEQPVETIVLAKVMFKFIVTDRIAEVLQNLVLHDTVSFTCEGMTYTVATRVTVTSKYLNRQDVQEVTVEVPHGEVVSRESTEDVTLTDI